MSGSIQTCLSCGGVAIAGAKFCAYDGIELSDQSPVVTIDQLRRCPSCARLFPLRAKFCAVDGVKLKEAESLDDFANSTGSATTNVANAASASTTRNAINSAVATHSPGSTNAADATHSSGSTNAADATHSSGGTNAADATHSSGGTNATTTKHASAVNETDGPAIRVIPSPAPVNTGELGLIGTTLDGKYRIQSMIAEGGMAILYRALQIAMERTVAIKVMKPNAAMTAVRLKRFEQECKLAARLNHPNIVSVYDVGWVSEQEPFLVMEFIDGNPLSADISEKGPPPANVAAQILIQILRGLEEAHAAGIIHRDLKPDNILLQKKSDRADWVKIVDFGIANFNNSSKRITQHGALIGTPVYMAPEQFKDGPIDHRADVYAMGILMFEILTGDVPFDGNSPQVIMLKQLMDEPPDLASLRKDIPSSFDLIIKRALAKDPEERFQSVREFREALELAVSGSS